MQGAGCRVLPALGPYKQVPLAWPAQQDGGRRRLPVEGRGEGTWKGKGHFSRRTSVGSVWDFCWSEISLNKFEGGP